MNIQINKTYLLFLVVSLLLISCNNSEKKGVTGVNSNIEEATFVGAESCKSCHETEYALWKNSHHDLAMKLADSISVLGDFNNTEFIHKGVSHKFFKKDGDYYMNTADKQGVIKIIKLYILLVFFLCNNTL